MPTWTAERDQRLLLLIIESVKVNAADLATAYKVKYSAVDDYEPTPRAITGHIGALKKAAAGGKASAKSTPMKHAKAMTATPKKGTAVKTPPGSRKRSRKFAMSEDDDDDDNEDDDSEAELKRLKETPTGPREKLNRRSKSVSKTYHGGDSGDDEGDGFVNGNGIGGPSSGSAEVNELGRRLDRIPFQLPTAVKIGTLTPGGKVVGTAKSNAVVDGYDSDDSNFSGEGFGLGY